MKNNLRNIVVAMALVSVLLTGASVFAEDNHINPNVSVDPLGKAALSNTDDENALGTRFGVTVEGDPAGMRYRNRG